MTGTAPEAPTPQVPRDRLLSLFEAAECGDLDEFLQHYGDDEQDARRLGHPLLLAALGNPEPAERYRIAGYLVDQGARPVANRAGFGPLHLAFARAWSDPEMLTDLVRRLLSAGADPDARTYDGRTPTHLLARLPVPDERAEGLYDLWFGNDTLDLVTPNAFGVDPVDLVRRIGGRPRLLRRMQEHRAAHDGSGRSPAPVVPEVPSLIPGAGYCLSTRHVVEGAAPVSWMVREEPAGADDTGWRFWSEEDVPRYSEDRRQTLAVPIDEVAAIDHYVVGAWGMPVGTRLVAARGAAGRQVLDPATGEVAENYPFQPQETR